MIITQQEGRTVGIWADGGGGEEGRKGGKRERERKEYKAREKWRGNKLKKLYTKG